MKKLILNSFVSSLVFFGVGFFVIKGFAALSTATSGTPLTAGNWNNMISNFFWGSGSGGIYYNGVRDKFYKPNSININQIKV